MNSKVNRRDFLTRSALVASASMTVVTQASEPSRPNPEALRPPVAANSKGTLATGKIGKLTVSRLISGGNLISGWAHSRDLHYVPSLMRHYNSDEKVLETLQLLEERASKLCTIISTGPRAGRIKTWTWSITPPTITGT
jgi:hypothetical protein